MKTLKEVEVVERVRSKEEIDEEVYQRNLYYPYTVKKLLNSTYFKKYTNIISKEHLDYLINSLEQFCHCLHGIKEITSFNISNVAMYIVAKSETLRNEVYNPNEDLNYDFSSKKNILHVIIKQVLKKIDIKEIENDLKANKIIVNYNNEEHESLEVLSGNEIEKILFELIEKYDFCYADVITKILLELDLDNIIRFRKNSFYGNLEKSKFTFSIFLNYLNSMLYEINNLYERDGLFLYKMLETCVYTSDELKNIAKDSFKCTDVKFSERYCKKLSSISRKFLIKGFIYGMLNLKEIYLIEFSKYNNSDFKSFKLLSESDQLKYIKKISLNLDDSSIYLLYEIRKIKDKEIFNHLDKVEKLIMDISTKKDDILITKQQISSDNEQLIFEIKEKLEEKKNLYDIVDITLYNLREIGRMIQLLSLNILLENNSYFIKLNKYNNDLVWYVYHNKKQIYRELCVNTNDIERIYLLIKKYNNNLIIRKKYKLI